MKQLFYSLIILLTAISAFIVDNEDSSSRKVGPAKERLRTSGAMEALDFWSTSRAYPNRVIPDVGHYAAFEHSKQYLQGEVDQSLSVEPWRPIGPHNIGGRTISIAFNPLNPNTVYAGSASGGLWRSYTGGIGADAWDYVSTGFPVLGVNSIAIAPNDSNVMYIGTGEVYGYQNSIGGLTIRTTRGSYGIGILKTTDGGLTWSKNLDWAYNQTRGVQAIRINPLNPNTVWAATTEGTYKSSDAGSTWIQEHNVIMANDLAINPLDTNIVFAACGNLGSLGHGIYRTTDGGATWVQLTVGLPGTFGGKAQLAIYQSSPSMIFASIGNGSSSGAGTWLCKSTDNGDTWTTVSTQDYSTYQGWFAHFVGVNPVDSSKVICAGVDLWKSTTGGANLQQKSFWFLWFFGVPPPGGAEGPPDYSHADHHAIAYHPTDPDIIYFGTDGGVFRTTDGGETFEGRNGGYQTTQFYNGFSSAFTDSLLSIGGLQDNATAIYEGTVAWRRVIGGDGCWTAIHSSNPDIMYGTSQNLSLRKSTNRGVTWSGISPPSGTTSFVAPYVLSPSDPLVMYAGRDRIFKSTQGGGNWIGTNNNQPLDGNPAISMAISFGSPDTVYVGTAPVFSRARIFMTSNGGTSWLNVTDTLPDRYPIDIAVDPINSAKVYVAFSGFGTPHLFKSEDAGQAWTNIGSALPDVPTSSVVVDPLYTDHIYVGNDIGVYVSTDGGGSWQEFQDGMPDASIVMDLSISHSNRKLRAATHGNGVFERALLDEPTAISEDSQIASEFKLEQNYPNPFNPVTTIAYRLPRSAHVTIKVFNAVGQELSVLVDENQAAGSHEVRFDGSDLTSGVYFYRLAVTGVSGSIGNTFVETRKMLLVR